MPANESVFFSRKPARLLIGVGVLFLLLSFIMIAAVPNVAVTPITISLVMIGRGIWSLNAPTVRIGTDYVVVSPAPLRSATILDSEITDLERKKNAIVVHYHRHDYKSPRKAVIPLNSMDKADRDECAQQIDALAGARAGAAA